MAIQKITVNDISGGLSNTNLDVTQTGTGSIAIPSGTTDQRPGTPLSGYTRFNTSTGAMETYNGSSWNSLGGLTLQSVQTSNFTASTGNLYPANTTNGTITVTLPSSPTTGQQVGIIDYSGTSSTNNIILFSNGKKVNGLSSNTTINSPKTSITLIYIDDNRGWIELSSAYNNIQVPPYTVSYLAVAGGGAGAGSWGGGGGAGGMVSGSTTFSGGTVYTVVVGSGGSTSPSPSSGTNSSLTSITGLSVSSSGGGYGGGGSGAPGGSGGGGSGWQSGVSNPGGSGTPGQGNPGGAGQPSGPVYGGGGGGGAGASGSQGGIYGGGAGGVGLSSTITGSPVYYAGGGGGGGNNGGSGPGGNGGGGNGASSSSPGTAGTSGTGGGGGAPGNGGSGIIIISIPTIYFSGVYSGANVSTSGSNTILSFTSSGSYTA